METAARQVGESKWLKNVPKPLEVGTSSSPVSNNCKGKVASGNPIQPSG